MKKLLAILSICLLFGGCSDIEDCDTNDERDFMVLRFFDKETEVSKKIGFVITADNSPFTFVPFDDSTGVGLPLDPVTEETTFIFTSDTSVYSLTMTYELQLSIFDDECDPSFVFNNLDSVRYTFDSLSIPGRVTNRQLDTNVEVYF